MILTDVEIKITLAEAERLSWTHKPHPRDEQYLFYFEKVKYLLQAQLTKDLLHEQARVERIFQKIESGFVLQANTTTAPIGFEEQERFMQKKWQSFKKREGIG